MSYPVGFNRAQQTVVPPFGCLVQQSQGEESSTSEIIDYSVEGNHLYQRADGSLGIQEKSLGYVVGEQVVAPIIDTVGWVFKSTFGCVRSSLSNAASGLSRAYNFQILPGASAEELVPEHFKDTLRSQPELGDLPKSLEACENEILQSAEDEKKLKGLYLHQGKIYKKLGMYSKARESFESVLELDATHSAAKEEFIKIDNALRDPENFVASLRGEFLDEIGFELPTHDVFFSMSFLAYEDFTSGNVISKSLTDLDCKEPGGEEMIQRLDLRGWKLAVTSEREIREKHGYFALAFINEKTKNVVIAHRGTDISSPENLVQCFEILEGNRPDNYQYAENFWKEVKERYRGYAISHAGHSLGAVYAELLAYYKKEVAVTIESPGIFHMVASQFLTKEKVNPLVISYLFSPNLINTCNGHIGLVRMVDTPKSIGLGKVVQGGLEYVGSWKDKILGTNPWEKFGKHAVGAAAVGDQDIKDHQIKNIIPLIQFSEGKLPYRLVKKWPSGVQERIRFDSAHKSGHTASKQRSLKEIYVTKDTDFSEIGLEEFSQKSRKFLTELRSLERIPSGMSWQILSLFTIKGDKVYIKSDDFVFTALDFHQYIEQKIFDHEIANSTTVLNPFYSCCSLEKKLDRQEVSLSRLSLDFFFSLHSIKSLSEFAQLELKSAIQKLERNELYGLLLTALGEDFEEKIEEELLEDIPSGLIKSVESFEDLIENMFSQDTRVQFLDTLHQPEGFFIDKTITISRSGYPVFIKDIKDFSQDCRKLFFDFEGGDKLNVNFGEGCTANHLVYTSHTARPLLSYLREGEKGSEFKMVLSKDHTAPSWVKEGIYQILEVKQEEKRYMIKFGRKGSETSVYDIDVLFDKKNNVDKAFLKDSSSPRVFDDHHQLQRFFKASYISELFIPVSDLSINDIITIDDKIRDVHAEMNKEFESLKKDLVNSLLEDSGEYIRAFILNMIEKGVDVTLEDPKRVDEDLTSGVRIQRFEKTLQRLSELAKQLKKEHTDYPSILQEGVLEANYQKVVRFPEEDRFSISEGLRLFTESYRSTDALEDKDLIVFMGNTGAGKSTNIAGGMGCKLERVKNFIGQSILKLKPEDQEGCPKIGQSIASAETLYSQAFPVKETEDLALVDTPGLGENRGEEYKLCAALSIDQAFRRGRSIRSLVINIPWASFIVDRGNGVIDLFQELREFFPKIIEGDSGKFADSVHVLITKHNHIQESVLQKSLDAFVQETRVEWKKEIWGLLKSMFIKNQLRLSNPKATGKMRKAIESYKKSKGISIEEFNSMLDTPDIRESFAKKIQGAATAWNRNVFKRSLDLLKEKIAKESELQSLISQKGELENLLNQTVLAIETVSKGREGDFGVEERKAFKTCMNAIEHLDDENKNYLKTIRDKESQKEELQRKIGELNGKIREHSSGREVFDLFTYKRNPDDVLNYNILREGARKKAWEEGRSTNEEDFIGKGSVVAKEYNGYFLHSPTISRDYFIAPTNRKERERFEEAGITDSGKYRAEITGSRYELDLTRKVDRTGKKIVYYFTTQWIAGKPLPWINIKHDIAKIVKFSADLDGWHQEKSDLEKHVVGLDIGIGHFRELESNNTKLIGRRESECQDNVLNGIKENKKDIEERIDQNELDFQIAEQEHGELEKDRLMLASIFKTHWKVAEALNALARIVIERQENMPESQKERYSSNHLTEVCRSYQETFSESAREISETCVLDLRSPCGVITEVSELERQHSGKDEL